MASKTTIKLRLEQRQMMLEECYKAYNELLRGRVQQYTIGSRSLTRYNLDDLWDTIKEHEKEIDELETVLAGGGRRKAVGIVPRDI